MDREHPDVRRMARELFCLSDLSDDSASECSSDLGGVPVHEAVNGRASITTYSDHSAYDGEWAELQWNARRHLMRFLMRSSRNYVYYQGQMLIGDELVGRTRVRIEQEVGGVVREFIGQVVGFDELTNLYQVEYTISVVYEGHPMELNQYQDITAQELNSHVFHIRL